MTSASLTNHDTIPGFAPQHEIAVVPPGDCRAFVDHGRTQRVVGPGGVVGFLVVVEARPRLDDGVDVQHAELPAQPHDVERRRVDRQVHAETLPLAFGQQRRQQVAVVLDGHGGLDELHAVLLDDPPVAVVGFDDDGAGAVEVEVAVDERQCAASDRPESDHHDRPRHARVDGLVCVRRRHGEPFGDDRTAPGGRSG